MESAPLPVTKPAYTRREPMRLSRVFLMSFLFAVPCLLFGVLILKGHIRAFRELQAARNWIPIPATLLEVSMQTGKIEGDERTPPVTHYRLRARYAYSIAGKNYENSRVTFFDLPDSDPSIPLTFRELDHRRATGAPVTCYVNPANPREAVLFRKLPWFDMMGMNLIGFLCIFGGLLILSIPVFQYYRRKKAGSVRAG